MQPRAARRAWRRDMRDRKARAQHHPENWRPTMLDLSVTDAPDWTGAHCVGAGVEMQPAVATIEQIENAKRLCAGCPLALECHAHAESQGAGDTGAYGVHAGKWWGEGPVLLTECSAPECCELTERKFCSDECRAVVQREQARVRAAAARARVAVPA